MKTNTKDKSETAGASVDVLAQIVGFKKIDVSERKALRPLNDFKDKLIPSNRSLKAALQTPKASFIFECKKASPSKGLIREDFDLEAILDDYQDFASAISVLADKRYFQGELSFVKRASERVNLPILCKDFFIEPYQVFEARDFGADAILLMLSVLDDKTYLELAAIAAEIKLDVLTEVHSEQELERALRLDAQIIGINNRDLKTLSIDLATTEKLAVKIPKGTIIISESGIETRKDIQRLAPKVNGFLIGSSIMAQKDIRSACKSLIYGKVKICGLRQLSEVEQAAGSGAVFAGLMFYPKSKRYISIQDAQQLVSCRDINYVGIFVDHPQSELLDAAKSLPLFALQLHGEESQDYINQLRELLDKNQLSHIQIWRALAIASKSESESETNTNTLLSNDLFKQKNVDRYLLDAMHGQQFGGSGQAFDWQQLENINCEQVFLAGGINLNNITLAAKQAVYGLDISSGVESSPGIKSQKKIKQLFEQLKY